MKSDIKISVNLYILCKVIHDNIQTKADTLFLFLLVLVKVGLNANDLKIMTETFQIFKYNDVQVVFLKFFFKLSVVPKTLKIVFTFYSAVKHSV